MNEITYTFNQTNRERKALVPSAMKRINGSKSHRCTLPSDSLSPTQIRKLNGPVSIYNLNAPMSWGLFKAMPDDLQAQYQNNLYDRFGVGVTVVAEELFGLSGAALYRHNVRKGINLPKRNSRPSATEIAIFRAWVSGESPEPLMTINEPVESVEPEKPVESVSSVITDNPTIRSALTSVTLRLSGERDAMLEAISSVIGSSTVELEVTINFKEENKQ